MNWERRVEDHERGRVLSVNGKCMQTPRGTDHFLLGLGTGHWLLRGAPSPGWSLQEATLGRASELAGPACSGLCSSGLCVGIPLSPLGGTQRSSHHPRPHSTSPPCVLRATPHLRSSQPRAALGMDTEFKGTQQLPSLPSLSCSPDPGNSLGDGKGSFPACGPAL